ncbi:MAG: DUF465 domain-containing protein [Yoonia sp.]|nr:DUF465 domain-containing protein [Yoonia sp.]
MTTAKMEQIDVLRVELAILRQQHRDLDHAIEALHAQNSTDMLTIKRLKKQKLTIKDQMAALEDRITPDITA